ncbi:MAG: SDR family oxidoreductase [Geminicoccaceae bacterium]
MNRFDDKIALVTGAGNGIGRATALRLASEGARLIILDREAEPAERTAADAGEGHTVLVADTTDPVSLNAALDQIDRLDVLVSNTGGTRIGNLDHLDPHSFDSELQLSLKSSYAVCHRVLPLMLEAGKGAIVFTSSINGMLHLGNPGYGAAKAGLLHLMRSIAVEYGSRGIRANAVSPGTIRTSNYSWTVRQEKDPEVFEKLAKWYPVGRIGEPDDIAAAIAFLAADEAGFVNGANLVVDGGLTAGLAPMIKEFVTEND